MMKEDDNGREATDTVQLRDVPESLPVGSVSWLLFAGHGRRLRPSRGDASYYRSE